MEKTLMIVSQAYSGHSESKPVVGIAKCKRKICGAAKRVDGFSYRSYEGYGRYVRQIEWPTVTCSYGRPDPSISEIRVTVTEHVCGGACTSATGPNCECSCGGANHGVGH